jgi:hypothetical protein
MPWLTWLFNSREIEFPDAAQPDLIDEQEFVRASWHASLHRKLLGIDKHQRNDPTGKLCIDISNSHRI